MRTWSGNDLSFKIRIKSGNLCALINAVKFVYFEDDEDAILAIYCSVESLNSNGVF